jgi:GNAT superfamily N-acetyltransferase
MPIPVMTAALATRLERAEAEFWTARLAPIRRVQGNPLGVEIQQFGEATAFIVRALPDNPTLNRVIGLTAGDEDLLDEVLGWYRERAIRCHADISPFACGFDLLARLDERGLYASGWQTILYGVPHSGAVPLAGRATAQVKRCDPADRGAFIDLRLRMPDIPAAERAFWKGIVEAEYSDPGWRCYVAEVDGQPASMGALHLRGGVGILAVDKTLAEYRGRGCQTALLRARLADAAAAGCELVTAQAEPGSVSQRNLERAGLRTAYTRVAWTERVRDDRG